MTRLMLPRLMLPRLMLPRLMLPRLALRRLFRRVTENVAIVAKHGDIFSQIADEAIA